MPNVLLQRVRELNYMRRLRTALHRDDGMALGGTSGIWQALRISCTFQTHSASRGKTLLISTAQNKQAHHKVGGRGEGGIQPHTGQNAPSRKSRVSICSMLHRKCTNMARALYTQQQQQHATPKALSVAPELPKKKQASRTPTAG